MEYKDVSATNFCLEKLRFKLHTLNNGDSLPSERALVNSLKVSRTSLRNALKILRNEGKILSQERQGMLVNKKVSISMLGMNSMSTQLVTSSKREIHIKFIESKIVKASTELAEFFNVSEATQLIRITRSRTIDKHPATFETAFLLKERFPSLLKVNFTEQSLYTVLENLYDISPSYGHEKIGYASADQTLASLLDIPKNKPLYKVSSYTYSNQDDPIEYALQYLVSDYFKYSLYAKNVLDYQEDDENELI